MVYVPLFKKYFFVEDECATCPYEKWLDLWMESSRDSDAMLVDARQSALTGDLAVRRRVVIDPPPGLTVDRSRFFEERGNAAVSRRRSIA